MLLVHLYTAIVLNFNENKLFKTIFLSITIILKCI